MWRDYWPTAWLFLAPLMMLAGMTGMFFLMCAAHARHHRRWKAGDIGLGHCRAYVAARFPGERSPLEELRTETVPRREEEREFHGFLARLRSAKDKAEVDANRGAHV